MKRDQAWSVEGIRSAAVAPAQVMQRHDQVDRLAALRLGAYLLKPHLIVPIEALPFTMEVVAVLGAQRCQVRLPGLPGQGNKRAGVGLPLRHAPAALAQGRTDSRGQADTKLELRPVEHEPLPGQARCQGLPRFRFTASPYDDIEIIGTGIPASQEL